MNVDIYGMGYVGLTLGLALAKRGVKVFGKDVDENKIKQLQECETCIKEPFILDLLIQSKRENTIYFTTDLFAKASDIAIVTIGTSLHNGTMESSHRQLHELVEFLDAQEYKIIILRSTVAIGTCDALRAKVNNAIIVFAPERTIEGNAIQELNSLPQILACPDPEGIRIASNLFNKLKVKLIVSSSYMNGEMAKLMCNIQRDYEFAFANEMALMCTQLGINSKDLIKLSSEGYDRFNCKSTGPVSGPCLTKDTEIFNQSLSALNFIPSELFMHARNTNKHVIKNIIHDLRKLSAKKILAIGTSFKSDPETSDTRESHTIKIVNSLNLEEIKCDVFDPHIDTQGQKELKEYIITKPDFDKYQIIFIGSNNIWIEKYLLDNNEKIKKTKKILYFCYEPNNTIMQTYNKHIKVWAQ